MIKGGKNMSSIATNYVYDGLSSTNTTCTTANVKSIVDELTKKPEVREDQRSALNVSKDAVYAYYYKDGFFTDSKHLIPAIKSIEVFNENTIKMTFTNGHVQIVTAQNGDSYDFEDGLLRCIVKEMIGKEGTAVLGKLLSYATKVYENAKADKMKKVEKETQKKAIAKKNYESAKARWAKKRAAERENRIQEMAEAIVRAEEMKKNV